MQRTKLGLSVYSANHECKCKRSPSCFSPAFPLSLPSPVISSSLFVIHPPAVHKNFLAIQKYSNIIPAVNKKKKRAIKRFYTLVLSVLRVRQRKRECMHVCVMSAVWLPAAVLLPTGALLSFVRLQGVEKRETKIESPVTKTSPARALSSLIYSPEGVLQKRIKEICAAWKAGQHFYQVLYVSNTEHSFRANKNSI